MAALHKSTRVKLRVIVLAVSLWGALALAVALWPRFPVGNCPDTPPDTAYVCRVAFGQDFERATKRRNVLLALESGIVVIAGSLLWLLAEKPLRRGSFAGGSTSRLGSSSPAGGLRPPPQPPAPASPAPGPASPSLSTRVAVPTPPKHVQPTQPPTTPTPPKQSRRDLKRQRKAEARAKQVVKKQAATPSAPAAEQAGGGGGAVSPAEK